jgi:hypothetical protein
MYVDAPRLARCDHYRAVANELRLIVLRMKHAEVAEALRLLADSYERLAERTAPHGIPLDAHRIG